MRAPHLRSSRSRSQHIERDQGIAEQLFASAALRSRASQCTGCSCFGHQRRFEIHKHLVGRDPVHKDHRLERRLTVYSRRAKRQPSAFVPLAVAGVGSFCTIIGHVTNRKPDVHHLAWEWLSGGPIECWRLPESDRRTAGRQA